MISREISQVDEKKRYIYLLHDFVFQFVGPNSISHMYLSKDLRRIEPTDGQFEKEIMRWKAQLVGGLLPPDPTIVRNHRTSLQT